MKSAIAFTLPPFVRGLTTRTLADQRDYNHALMNIPAAWEHARGAGVKIAIIDTGLPEHRDFAGANVEAENFTDSPLEDRVVGHSTHVAGIIGARANNEGIVGIAPDCDFVFVKALDDEGRGRDDQIAAGVGFAIAVGAHVINLSLGVPAWAAPMMPKTHDAIGAALSKGITVIAASGNESAAKVGFPARIVDVIAVGAINSDKELAEFSNRGNALDLVVPGVDVLSTFKGNTYARLSGTSMASPMIAGLVALILAAHWKALARSDRSTNRHADRLRPTTPISKSTRAGKIDITTPPAVLDHLRKMAVDLGPVGFDPEFGWGMPDALKVPVFGRLDPDNPTEPPPPREKTLFEKFLEWLFGLIG